jgi:hypothetical protein
MRKCTLQQRLHATITHEIVRMVLGYRCSGYVCAMPCMRIDWNTAVAKFRMYPPRCNRLEYVTSWTLSSMLFLFYWPTLPCYPYLIWFWNTVRCVAFIMLYAWCPTWKKGSRSGPMIESFFSASNVVVSSKIGITRCHIGVRVCVCVHVFPRLPLLYLFLNPLTY